MNVLVSLLRTVVPLLVGWVVTATDALDLDVSSTTATAAVTALITAVYYLVFRMVEEAAARIGNETVRKLAGLALGYARPPEYKSTPAPAATQRN